jgi:hypothetical protein
MAVESPHEAEVCEQLELQRLVLRPLRTFVSPLLYTYSFRVSGPIHWGGWTRVPQFCEYYEALIGEPLSLTSVRAALAHDRNAFDRVIVGLFFLTTVHCSLVYEGFGSYEVQILLHAAHEEGPRAMQQLEEVVASPRFIKDIALRARAATLLAFVRRQNVRMLVFHLPRGESADLRKTRIALSYTRGFWREVDAEMAATTLPLAAVQAELAAAKASIDFMGMMCMAQVADAQ